MLPNSAAAEYTSVPRSPTLQPTNTKEHIQIKYYSPLWLDTDNAIFTEKEHASQKKSHKRLVYNLKRK